MRILGGADPYYQRCLRTRLIAGVLEELGFRLRINGALLDAVLDAAEYHQGRENLAWTGRLLVFSMDTDHALVGPWAIEALRNTITEKREKVGAMVKDGKSLDEIKEAFGLPAGQSRWPSLVEIIYGEMKQ